jgi:hypothetical protein
VEEKLVELVHMFEEVYGMTNKVYIDSYWKEKCGKEQAKR